MMMRKMRKKKSGSRNWFGFRSESQRRRREEFGGVNGGGRSFDHGGGEGIPRHWPHLLTSVVGSASQVAAIASTLGAAIGNPRRHHQQPTFFHPHPSSTWPPPPATLAAAIGNPRCRHQQPTEESVTAQSFDSFRFFWLQFPLPTPLNQSD